MSNWSFTRGLCPTASFEKNREHGSFRRPLKGINACGNGPILHACCSTHRLAFVQK